MLPESELPTHRYNIVPDLPSPPPPVLHPGTHEHIGPDDLAPLFPMASYQAYFDGNLVDYEHPQERIDDAMTQVPVVAG